MSTAPMRQSPIGRRYTRYKMQLAASAAVGAALRNAPPTFSLAQQQRLKVLARRIAACAASTTIRLVTLPGTPTQINYRNKRRCRSGLCPPCARQRARETVQRISAALDGIVAEAPNTRFAFLTLTSKNMPIAEVATMLALHERALNRFWRKDAIARAFVGQVTGIEIAIRRKNGRWEAGVHSHSTVALSANYFDRDAKTYLRQADIVRYWGKALGVDYKPVCHIRAIANTDAAYGSLIEGLKYAVAPHRLFERGDKGLCVDPAVAAHLASALYKRRLCRMSGVFAKRRRKTRQACAS